MSPRKFQLDETKKGKRSIVKCKERDVLMGRGNRISQWPGNINFRQLVNQFRDEYGAAERHTKAEIAKNVLDSVHAVGGRFLAQVGNPSDDKWTTVSPARALEKACQALREIHKCNPPKAYPFLQDDSPAASITPKKLSKASSVKKGEKTKASPKSKATPTSSAKKKKRAPPSSTSSKTVSSKAAVSSKSSAKASATPIRKGTRTSNRRRVPKLEKSTTPPTRAKRKLGSPAISSSDQKKQRKIERNQSINDNNQEEEEPEPADFNSPSKHSISPKDRLSDEAKTLTRKESEEDEVSRGRRRSASADSDKSESSDESTDLLDKNPGYEQIVVATPMERIRSLLEDEMIARLEKYVKQMGHCAVPPCAYDAEDESHNGVRVDVALSDWCIAQRQVYREVCVFKYRPGTESEMACIRRLESLDFVWDYQEWHWNQHYLNLQQYCNEVAAAREEKIQLAAAEPNQHQKESAVETTLSNDGDSANEKEHAKKAVPLGLPSESREWLLDQRQKQLEDDVPVSNERKKKLATLKVVI